jgi:hypothetical protein
VTARRVGVARGAALLTAAALLSACGPASSVASQQPVASAIGSQPVQSAMASALASALASPVTGVIVDVQATGLDQVSGFTLLVRGQRVAFQLGPLENATEFPAGHLKEHQATSEPIRVYFREAGSGLVVYRIEDAGS